MLPTNNHCHVTDCTGKMVNDCEPVLRLERYDDRVPWFKAVICNNIGAIPEIQLNLPPLDHGLPLDLGEPGLCRFCIDLDGLVPALFIPENAIMLPYLVKRDNIKNTDSHSGIAAGTAIDHDVSLGKHLSYLFLIPHKSHVITEPDGNRHGICIVRPR